MVMENGLTRPPPPAAAVPKKTSRSADDDKRHRAVLFKARHGLIVAFFLLLFFFHALAIYLFCSGFLLSRVILPDRSQCESPPVTLQNGYMAGSLDKGCWHPKTYDRAVVILIDALRYDFTVPFNPTPDDRTPHHFHNALQVLHETAVQHPQHAVLRPFIADPPTTTLQRLKALTTGTLPTFIEAGSNFAGTAIDEDNLIEQLYKADKRVVHLGDDTWHSLFPGYFEPNLTRPFDSFNVPDLHTVDNGVNTHLFPLLQPEMRGRWDVVIGHYLGVDHVGHNLGPDHPVMTEKLRQMDSSIRRIIELLDDDTLLVVMGDHGMDVKGDHGGESDDEVEAALWMYSKRAVFGRSQSAFVEPPKTAKERPVGQIDLVPTLALLLGMPIPFNNLGGPIEEAFIGTAGNDYRNLAEVTRLTAAQIRGYQRVYSAARDLNDSDASPVAARWAAAGSAWEDVQSGIIATSNGWKAAYNAHVAYQAENLQVCRRIWARFDIPSMIMGIVVLATTFIAILFYSQSIQGDRAALTPVLLLWSVAGTVGGGLVGGAIGSLIPGQLLKLAAFGAGLCGTVALLLALLPARRIIRLPYPRTFWGALCAATTLMLCVGFAANSFTIWEDRQLLFFLNTFGILVLGSSLGQADENDRHLGVLNSISFLLATRFSSLSRLCREEQMAACTPTFYASASSSTSAEWHLVIPFVVAIFLPSAISTFYTRTKNYQGSAVVWISIALRIGLLLVAAHWLLDAADNGDWWPKVAKETLQYTRTTVAQIVLTLAAAGGYATYIWASPFLLVKTEDSSQPAPPPASTSKPLDAADPRAPILTTINSNAAPAPPRQRLIVLGYANTHGTRYFLLATIWLLALLLVQTPMGQGALALCTISILNILEVLDANRLHTSPLGPILLALLASFHFFTTGHQAALSTIQWRAAFITSPTLSYPLSPLLVALNTFGPHLLCAIAAPAAPLWKVGPRARGALGAAAAAAASHALFYAAVALASVAEAAWLRRHLMLYRVFMPRMLLAAAALLLVELVLALVALVGVRWSMGSVGEVFGFGDEYEEEEEEEGVGAS